MDAKEEIRRLRAIEQIRQIRGTPAPAEKAPEAPPVRQRVQDVPDTSAGGSAMTRDQQTALNMAAGVNKTLLQDLPNIVVNAPGLLFNYAGEKTGLWDARAAAVQAPDAVKRFVDKGTTPIGDATGLNKAAFTAGQWGAPVPVKGSSLLTGVDVGMGAGAAAGGALADKVSDNENAGLVGELVGGFMGALKGRPGAATVASAPSHTGSFENAVPLSHDEKWQHNAAKVIAANAHEPQLAMANLEKALRNGEQGTLSQLTGDLGLANLETTVPKGTQTRREIEGLRQARESALRGNIAKTGPTADPAAAVPAAKTRLSRIREKLRNQTAAAGQRAEAAIEPRLNATLASEVDVNSRLVKARSRAQEASQRVEQARAEATGTRAEVLGDQMPTAEASTRLSAAVEGANAEHKALVEQPAWAAVTDAPAEPMQPLYDEINRVVWEIHNQNPQAAQKLISKYGSHLKDFGRMGTEATPQQVNTLLSDIKGELRAKSKSVTGDSYGSTEKHLSDIMTAVDDYMRTRSFSSREFEGAMSATKENRGRFASGQVGKARDKEPELMAKAWNTAGDAGAVTLRELQRIGSPEVRSAAIDRLISEASEAPDLQKFINERKQFLEGFPAVRERLEQVVAGDTSIAKAEDTFKLAETVADDAGKSAEASIANSDKERARLIKSVQEAEKSAAKRYQGLSGTLAKRDLAKFADKPTDTMAKILKDTDKGAQRLHSLIAKVKGGEESVKAAARDAFMARVVPDKTGKASISGSSVDQYLELRPTMEASGAMTTKELDEVWEGLSRGMDDAELQAAAKVIIPSKMSTEITNLIASVATVAVSPAFGAKQSLILNGAIRRAFRRALEDRKQSPALVTHMDKFLTDPESLAKFKDFIIPKMQDVSPKDLHQTAADIAEHVLRSFKPVAIGEGGG